MRTVVCDPHVTFGESLAHVLTASGARVVAVVQHLPEVVRVLSRQQADLCVVSIPSNTLTDAKADVLRSITGQTAVLVLAESVDADLRTRCISAGVRGLAEMRQDLSKVLRQIDKVRRGEPAFAPVSTGHPSPSAAAPGPGASDTHRLASFLTGRERAVLSALVRGQDTATIAKTFGISRTTARGHVQGVLTKLGTHTRIGAVTIAVNGGLVNPRTGDWLVGASR